MSDTEGRFCPARNVVVVVSREEFGQRHSTWQLDIKHVIQAALPSWIDKDFGRFRSGISAQGNFDYEIVDS